MISEEGDVRAAAGEDSRGVGSGDGSAGGNGGETEGTIEGMAALVPIEVVNSLETLYDLGRTIGRGEFAKVKLARCLATQQLVAIKIIRIEGRGERLFREISILSRVSHPNIIKLMRVLQLPDRIALVMEYASGGEVFDYVQLRGHLPEAEVRLIMRQILLAVEFLHRRGVVHRDLKLENLLRLDDGRVALTDFGFATVFNAPGRVLQTACGSPCYAAPELVLDKKGYCGPAADLWSCGVIMYAMAYGFLPFESDLHLDHSSSPVVWTPTNVYQLYQYIASQPLRLPAAPSDGLDERGRDLLLRLLDSQPEGRISMEQVWRHPWMANAP